MDDLRVLLLCDPSLLCDGVTLLLRRTANVTLVGPWSVNDPVLERLAEHRPDIILMTEPEDDPNEAIALTSQILERYSSLPVVRVGLEHNMLRLFASHALPATVTALIATIRSPPPTTGRDRFGR